MASPPPHAPSRRPRPSRAGPCVVVALLLLVAMGVVLPPATLAAPDDARAEYARLVAAAKARRWAEALPLATALATGHPDAPFAPAATSLASEAAWRLQRYDVALAFAERYVRAFPAGERAERMGLRRGEALFRLGRGPEARAAFGAVLAGSPSPAVAALARTLSARIDPQDLDVRGPVVFSYRGKYEGDPRLERRREELLRLLPDAVRRVRDRLGVGGDAVPDFRVRFRDTGETPDGAFMSTITELVGGAPRLAVVVRTERLVVGYDVATVLTHELTHVVQRHRMGWAADAVPAWAREGAATWVAEQGRRRLTTDLWGLVGAPDPAAALLDGLEDPTQAEDYAENWLAFAWIEATKGPQAARALARRVCETGDAEAAFATASARPFAEALVAERAWARERITAELEDRDAYLAARRTLSSGPATDAVAALEAFLSAHPASSFAPKVRMDRAVALARAGRLRDANEAFGAILASPWADTFGDDVVEQHVRIASAHRDLAGVERWGGRFLRDFSYVKAERLRAVRALWTRLGGTPPPPPPEDPLEPSDLPEASDGGG